MPVFGTTAPDTGANSGLPGEADCTICGHPLQAHDPIGLRYCAATVAGGLSRGCVCAMRTYDKPDNATPSWTTISSTTAKDPE